MIRPKTDKEIELMRYGGKELARIIKLLSKKVTPGVSGKEIAKLALQEIKAADLEPVLMGYQGFPDCICISLNQAVVHGIPSSEKFKEGDLVKLDLTVGYKGMVVDSAITAIASDKPINQDVKRLIEGTRRALDAGIAAIKGDGTRVGDISAAIEDELNRNHLGIVRDLVGHGVGYGVHEEPNVPNYGSRGSGPKLTTGTTIAVEPMATLGTWQVGVLKDGWTVITRDGSLAGNFEHTVLVTDNGAEILTL